MKNLKKKLSKKAKAALALAAVIVLAVALHPSIKPQDIVSNSVTITNIAGTSGGSGTVLHSSETYSEVLTNSHVCNVVKHGGKVTGPAGSFLVASFGQSKVHDLCLLSVEGNLKAETKIADEAPTAYYESASISGHPQLMPTVVTKGHFSGRRTISVMRGMKACTPEQQNDPNTGIICALVGGFPDIMQYDSTLVTATIMPGSSGSGVYNSKNELSAVVFAGAGDLAYAWTVPYESMKNFVEVESNFLQVQQPDNSVGLSMAGDNSRSEEAKIFEKLKQVCGSPNRAKIKDTCRLVEENIVWNKE
jgi:S1-C subfamily serine protease